MNQTINDILSRVSVKDFSDKEVDDKLLDEILECGVNAPSAKNQQSCVIISIKDKTLKKELVEISKEHMNLSVDPFHNANVIVLVASLKDSIEPIKDGSCILENMFIAAQSLGLSSCWINCVKALPSYEKGLNFMKKINISEDYIFVGACALGYPNKTPEHKTHKLDYIRKF